MAKAKSGRDQSLYDKLRDSGVRKKVAARAADALPTGGVKSPAAAQRVADELSAASEAIKDRLGGGTRKRSEAAKKAATTRKATATAKKAASTRKASATKRSTAAKKAASTRGANAAKRSTAAKKGAATRKAK